MFRSLLRSLSSSLYFDKSFRLQDCLFGERSFVLRDAVSEVAESLPTAPRLLLLDEPEAYWDDEVTRRVDIRIRLPLDRR